jgi:hypothetical protein
MGTVSLGNPFVVGKYVSDEYFCDRQEETVFLKKQLENGRNVALISPRRIGKSGLIHHLFQQPEIQERYYVFYVDIYATTSLGELVYTLGKEIYEQLKPVSTKWKERFFKVISSLRMGFKLDNLTGTPTFDIGLGDIQTPHTTLDEIFQYIDEADKPCIIAIDEFQQISEYTEKNVEALLRTKIQCCQKGLFLFSGSKRHMMSQMFLSSSKPFYQSAITMGLEPIPLDTYSQFVKRLFEERGKTIADQVTSEIWNRYDGYTWYVQMMMNELFAITPNGGKCMTDIIETARKNVILSQEMGYKEIMNRLAPKQKMVLQAIAKEGKAQNITSAKFVQKYHLNSASSVQAAIKLLLKNEIITQEDGYYRLSDFFFAEWIAKY